MRISNKIKVLVIAVISLTIMSNSSEAFGQMMKKKKTPGTTGAITRVESAPVLAGPVAVNRVNSDTNGDGKTDFLIARAAGDATAASTPVDRWNSVNRGADSFRARRNVDKIQPLYDGVGSIGIQWWSGQQNITPVLAQLGDSSTDFVVIEDFDGDGKDDFAVWRPGPPDVAKFIILESSTNTYREELFGQTGDDPTVTGDYDGDGKADPATFRCPTSSAAQCYFFYRGSLNNSARNITYIPWGYGIDGDFYANPGDFDGDGKMDFCLQRTAPGTSTSGQFVLLKSSNWGVEYVTWGNNTDYIIPGDYDGDAKADFCVRQSLNGKHYYWILTRTGTVSVTQFGQDGDISAPGDYDGDGRQDFALWREDQANADNNYFWVRRSSDGTLFTYEWGMGFDYPVANWYVH